MTRPKVFYPRREIVDRRLKEGWTAQPFKGRNEILWPPPEHEANKNQWTAEFVKIGPTLFIPHWGLY